MLISEMCDIFAILCSNFEDIFDVKHFIDTLRDEVHIVKQLPKRFGPEDSNNILNMPPVSWSDEKYYLHQVCTYILLDTCLLYIIYSSWYLIYADLTIIQQI
mgnify:CR=1 FL=1